ncbi:hypothetical protein D3OALGB2SA_2052 [Olavius algarvensis associated proteobacterium Delta 3]|nr:hypothetical protein D3OALGB2SA_2052 [Olavius algarvensis associated proteobacterium Delta 3]
MIVSCLESWKSLHIRDDQSWIGLFIRKHPDTQGLASYAGCLAQSMSKCQ